MTPNSIEILIHYHVSPTPHPRIKFPAVQDELASLFAKGLIEPHPQLADVYRTTARGDAHIKQLCELDFPVQAWVDAHGNVISTNP